MTDDVDYVFHAGRLLENPAWRKLIDDTRLRLSWERDAVAWDAEERHYISIAETLLTKLERRAEQMAMRSRIEQFHREQAERQI